jgi:catechol 2,3-dioxygenase-like lactoylglutathione lyase family enzyme
MAIERLDHVQVGIPRGGEDRGRRFYGELLGMREVPKPPNLAVDGGAWFECGELRVHLGVEDDFRPPSKAHLAFVVSHLQSLMEKLRASGYAIVAAKPLEGFDRMYTFDPFGNRIEFLQRR